jgi:methyl-accepting chemotaxis protein
VRFSNRYLLTLVVPPAAVTLPLALLFLSQVLQLTVGTAAILIALLIALHAAEAATFRAALASALEPLETSVSSDTLSAALTRTRNVSLLFWPSAGLLFALIATLLIMRSGLGFTYFIVAALIAAVPSIAWSYEAGKRQLLQHAGARAAGLRYIGPELSIGKKIAIVFIGSFLVSSVVLIELVSSKVSTTLEALAISSASDRYQRVLDTALVSRTVDAKTLDTLREYIPPEYSLHLLEPNGSIIDTGDPLTPDEVEAIRRIRTGDSLAFISPHVCKFTELRNHAILVMSIPWTPYKSIPLQITGYTLVVALLTMIAFAVATYFLTRDITAPMHELRGLASGMAQGNFDVEPRIFADDEMGQLAASFAETRSNLRRLLGRVGGSGTTITEGVRVITGGTESLMTRARDQAELTESSSLAVENVRAGISSVLSAADTVTDLTQDASSRALEMQASAEEVARSMDYLFQSVEKTSSSTTEMDASMREMSRRTDVLAGIGDEVLSFVSQMDSTIEELRASSQSTAEISRQVREDAEAGGEAVGRTVQGIILTEELTNSTAKVLDDLQRSVGEISGILNVIEEVTNRTNLLALNAAIIAAQAGEHGLGFTVVADEIRQLAERTRGSTKEIGTIIKAVQTGSKNAVTKIHEGVVRVGDNVRLAENAATSLAKIVESSARSYEMATNISRALDEQAKASRHLHEVTSRMSDHIAEINRGTREQARGTQLMAQESERVREIAGQVKNATDEQSVAGRGISSALEKIAEDARAMRDLLDRQLRETDQIADASRMMLDIAQENDAIAREFSSTVQNLVQSGREFESEVGRFRISGT